MTKEEAARINCKSFAESRGLKAAQLEREIQQCTATAAEKANMLHTLSKFGIFAADERDHLARLASGKDYRAWLGESAGTGGEHHEEP